MYKAMNKTGTVTNSHLFTIGPQRATQALRLGYSCRMSYLNSPPDYTKFSIVDFEQTFDLLRTAMLLAGGGVCGATTAGRPSPAALFAEQRYVNPPSDDLAAMVQYLRAAVFPTSEQNERALILIIKYELDIGGSSIASIAQMIEFASQAKSIAA